MDGTDELTAFDRCDVSRVEQARVRWRLPNKTGKHTEQPLELLFCKHHSEQYETELDAQGWVMVANNREQLTKRAVGAEVS